jgi:hypothetical protein
VGFNGGSDGGTSWEPQKSGTDNDLVAVYFADARTGWAVGDHGTILATRDGGTTGSRRRADRRQSLQCTFCQRAHRLGGGGAPGFPDAFTILSKRHCCGSLVQVAKSDLKKIDLKKIKSDLKKITYFTRHQTIVRARPDDERLCARRRSHSRTTTPNVQATFPTDFHPIVKILTKKSFEGFRSPGGESPG